MKTGFTQLLSYIADHPTSLPGRIAAWRFGVPSRDSQTHISRFKNRPYRVLIAPVNYSAQAHAWAHALETADPRVSATNMSIEVPGGFSFPTGLEVPRAVYHNGRRWQRAQFEYVAANATHVLIEAMEPPFGRLFGRSVARQVDALQSRGVHVGFIAHGTEVRHPGRHAERDAWSYYRDESEDFSRAEIIANRNISFLSAQSAPVFVSTPDLLLDLPNAQWCPVVVRPSEWATPRMKRDASQALRVAHAPTNPKLKGTPLIEDTLKKLDAAGLIELELVRGVRSEDMPALYARTDVYLDQFRLGSYGVAACEAMAAGCAVLGHVNSVVRDHVQRASGRRLPIIETTPDTLSSVLVELAEHRDTLDQASTEGVAFVSEVHDGRRSSATLLNDFVLR